MNDTYVDFCLDFKVEYVFPMVVLPESHGQYTDDHREDAHHLFLCAYRNRDYNQQIFLGQFEQLLSHLILPILSNVADRLSMRNKCDKL